MQFESPVKNHVFTPANGNTQRRVRAVSNGSMVCKQFNSGFGFETYRHPSCLIEPQRATAHRTAEIADPGSSNTIASRHLHAHGQDEIQHDRFPLLPGIRENDLVGHGRQSVNGGVIADTLSLGAGRPGGIINGHLHGFAVTQGKCIAIGLNSPRRTNQPVLICLLHTNQHVPESRLVGVGQGIWRHLGPCQVLWTLENVGLATQSNDLQRERLVDFAVVEDLHVPRPLTTEPKWYLNIPPLGIFAHQLKLREWHVIDRKSALFICGHTGQRTGGGIESIACDPQSLVLERPAFEVNEQAVNRCSRLHHEVQCAGLVGKHKADKVLFPVLSNVGLAIGHGQIAVSTESPFIVARLGRVDGGHLETRAPCICGLIQHVHARSELKHVLPLFIGQGVSSGPQ